MEIKIEQGRPILPHARASERVHGVRLDWDSVLMSTRRFLGRGMLRVYGDLSLGVYWWYGRGRLSRVDMVVVRRGDVVARYLHRVGPGGRYDLRAVTLIVGWGGRGHRVGRGGNVRVRRGGSRELRDIRWCGIRVYRRPSRRSL
jgi:hypothetical protein